MRAAITLAAVGTAATALSLVSASHNDNSVANFGAARRHHAKAAALELEQRSLAAAIPATEEELAMEKRGTYNGQATWYIVNTGNQGSCGGYLSPWEHTVALNEPMYGDLNSESSWCNKKIVISANGKQTTATIRDACPESAQTCHYGSLDMSVSLFTFFNPQSVGVFDIKWWPAGEGPGPSPAQIAAAKAAAAKKAAAAAAAAAAERKKESIASKKSKSSASVKSVKSVKSSKSHYSHTKSVASVKSVSSASSKSVKSVASAASKAASAEQARESKLANQAPNNVHELKNVQHALKNMVANAKHS